MKWPQHYHSYDYHFYLPQFFFKLSCKIQVFIMVDQLGSCFWRLFNSKSCLCTYNFYVNNSMVIFLTELELFCLHKAKLFQVLLFMICIVNDWVVILNINRTSIGTSTPGPSGLGSNDNEGRFFAGISVLLLSLFEVVEIFRELTWITTIIKRFPHGHKSLTNACVREVKPLRLDGAPCISLHANAVKKGMNLSRPCIYG